MSKHKLSLVIFGIFLCATASACQKKIQNEKFLTYAKYANFNQDFSELVCSISIQKDGTSNTERISVNYTPEKTMLKNIQSKSVVSSSEISDGKMSIVFSSGRTQVFEDSLENRSAFGLLPELGTNPYYSLRSDMNPELKELSVNEITAAVIYQNRVFLQHVTFSENKLVKISTFVDNVKIQESVFDDFLELKNGTFFPRKTIRTTFTGGKEEKNVITYSIEKVSFI